MPQNISFLLFFRSRSDFSIFRKSKQCVYSAAAVSLANDIPETVPDTFKALTLESKMDVKDHDKYQMLANLESTAMLVAIRQLFSKQQITKIDIIGALLDCKNKSGTIYCLTMDFVERKSTIVMSQYIESISQVLSYLFAKI